MEGVYEYPAVLGLASRTLALAGAGEPSLPGLLHQRRGGGHLALFSAVVTAGATELVLRRSRPRSLSNREDGISARRLASSLPGRATPPAPGEPTTSSLPPGATGHADNGPVKA